MQRLHIQSLPKLLQFDTQITDIFVDEIINIYILLLVVSMRLLKASLWQSSDKLCALNLKSKLLRFVHTLARNPEAELHPRLSTSS